MKTTLDSTQRIFIIIDSWGRAYACNLNDIPLVFEYTKRDSLRVFHIWNGKQQKVSAKLLRDMMEAAAINPETINQSL